MARGRLADDPQLTWRSRRSHSVAGPRSVCAVRSGKSFQLGAKRQASHATGAGQRLTIDTDRIYQIETTGFC